jgi:hypothetical protein
MIWGLHGRGNSYHGIVSYDTMSSCKVGKNVSVKYTVSIFNDFAIVL